MSATIGASELAVCCGLQARDRRGQPYTSALELSLRLRGLLPRYDDSDSPAAAVGRAIEPGIGLRYAAERGNVLVVPGPQLPAPGFGHPDEQWLSVRPDFLVPALARGLECKAPRELGEEWGAAGTDEIPTHYLIQVIAQLAVEHALWGWEVQDLAAMARDTWDASRAWAVYTVRRDADLEARVLGTGRDWYRRHVEDGIPPAPDGSDSAGLALTRLWQPVVGVVRDATPDDLADLHALLSVKSAIAELEGRKAEIEHRMQARMGAATELRDGPRRLATWRPREGAERLDAKALRREHPDLAARYTQTGEPGRTWRLS